MVGPLKANEIKLSEDKKKRLNEFLEFVEKNLKEKFGEYSKLIKEKKGLQDTYEKSLMKIKKFLKLENDEREVVDRKLKKTGERSAGDSEIDQKKH